MGSMAMQGKTFDGGRASGSGMRVAEPADTRGVRSADITPLVLCTVELRQHEQPSRAYVTSKRGVRLGSIDVLQYEGRGLHLGNRLAEHIAVDHLDDYLISIPLDVHVDFEQTGCRGSVEPGAFALLSTSMPFMASISGRQQQGVFSGLNIRISGAALRRRLPTVDRCCGRPIQTRSGAGMIMRRMCEMAIEEGRNLSDSEAGQLGSMLIDAVVIALSHAPEVLHSIQRAPRATPIRIWKQATAYIEAELPNPGLDTDAVARHCHVSKRYLQAAFAEMDQTVCGVIRELRLQRCRESLRNPALRRQSIAQIAMHWGFNDLPNFCRSYKARFDRSPGRDRTTISADDKKYLAA